MKTKFLLDIFYNLNLTKFRGIIPKHEKSYINYLNT